MFSNKILIQLVFFATLVVVFALGVMPHSVMRVSPHVAGWTKADHLVSFFVLTVLGVMAFPEARPLLLGAALSAVGGLIEIVQALPFVARDGRFNDWVIDSLAILTALGPILLASRNAGPGALGAPMSAATASDYAAE